MDRAPGIDQHHIAFIKRLGLGNPVRESGVRAKQDNAEGRAARRADRLVGGVDEFGDLTGRDPRTQDAGRRCMDLQRRGLGRLHERDLVGILGLAG